MLFKENNLLFHNKYLVLKYNFVKGAANEV